MGNANCVIENDSHQQVHVRSYNNADLIYLMSFDSYTLNPGEQKTINAAADAWGLKVKVCFEHEEFSSPFFCKNGSRHRVSEILPLHSLKLKNDSDAEVQFFVTDRNDRNSSVTIASKSSMELKNLIRGDVSVSVVKDGVACNVTRSTSNGTVHWDGKNLVASH